MLAHEYNLDPLKHVQFQGGQKKSEYIYNKLYNVHDRRKT